MLDNLFTVTRILVPGHWARMKFGEQLQLYVTTGEGEADLRRVATSAKLWR